MTAQAQPLSGWGLLRNRNFGSLWLGQVVSGFGDRITIIAIAAVIWELTQSSLYTALAVLVATVPHAFFGFFAGPIADALGPRRTMVWCDLVRAVVVAAIPLVIILRLPLALVYALVLAATLCASLFGPARLSLLPSLVAQRELGGGNSVIVVSDKFVEIVGSAAAGVLVAMIGSAAFYIDAATFVFSAFMLQRIALQAEEVPQALSLRGVVDEAGTGMRVIRQNAVLWANMLFSVVAQVSIGILAALTPVFVFRDLRGGPDAFGASEAAIALGAVLFGFGMPFLMKRVAKGRLVVAGFATFGATLVMLSQAPSIEIALVLFAAAGMSNVVFLIPNITIYQEHTPAPLRARVFGTRFALLNLTWLPIMLAGGYMGDVVGAGTLIGLAGLLTLGTALVGLLIPAVRDVS